MTHRSDSAIPPIRLDNADECASVRWHEAFQESRQHDGEDDQGRARPQNCKAEEQCGEGVDDETDRDLYEAERQRELLTLPASGKRSAGATQMEMSAAGWVRSVRHSALAAAGHYLNIRLRTESHGHGGAPLVFAVGRHGCRRAGGVA